ncbi:hypothetical protein BCR35DRAFT_305612 [Leucosporidium creatinivorum]|uniref:Septin-type G domain-containing protein n=1 Tax=Leucosporidium creatinivorum TaxID=106004 RepID=A0A1Y2EZG1_9BASI|nr:hypothetical protein BCR35DRAFT_305612 [Leucosporidium creatinivorum]
MFSRRKSSQRTPTVPSPSKPTAPTLPAFETSSSLNGEGFALSLPPSSAIPLTAEGNPPLRRPSTASTSPSKAPIVATVAPTSFHRPSSSRRRDEPESPTRASISQSNSLPSGFGPQFGAPSWDPHASSGAREGGGRLSIASLYPSPTAGLNTPSTGGGGGIPKSASLPSIRRSHKIPPTLNVMVVGARGTGKTSWIRTLLGNLDLAGTKGKGERAAGEERIAQFGAKEGGRGKVERTKKLDSVTVDVLNRGERTSLTVVDTVGWEAALGGLSNVAQELEMERQLSAVMRNVEGRFDETLKAEAQLIRHSHRAHDSHLHLAIYFIHPESVTTRPPLPKRTTKISLGRSLSTPHLARKAKRGSGGEPVWDDEDVQRAAEEPTPMKVEINGEEEELGLSEVDLRAIMKLARRVNVLPVISRSDTLTITRLSDVKAAVKRDLDRAGLGFGVFAPSSSSSTLLSESATEVDAEFTRGRNSIMIPAPSVQPPLPQSQAHPPLANGLVVPAAGSEGCEDGSTATKDAPEPTTTNETQDDSDLLSPQPVKLIRTRSTSRLGRRRTTSKRLVEGDEQDEDEGETEPATPSYEELLPFALVAPERIGGGGGAGGKEEWVREFKFGKLDVLNSEHCDFTPLRQSILGNAKILRDTTRLEKYEPYRTQRLLQRRATRELPAATRDSILHEVEAL